MAIPTVPAKIQIVPSVGHSNAAPVDFLCTLDGATLRRIRTSTQNGDTVLHVLSHHAPRADDHGGDYVGGAFPISSPRELSHRLD